MIEAATTAGAAADGNGTSNSTGGRRSRYCVVVLVAEVGVVGVVVVAVVVAVVVVVVAAAVVVVMVVVVVVSSRWHQPPPDHYTLPASRRRYSAGVRRLDAVIVLARMLPQAFIGRDCYDLAFIARLLYFAYCPASTRHIPRPECTILHIMNGKDARIRCVMMETAVVNNILGAMITVFIMKAILLLVFVCGDDHVDFHCFENNDDDDDAVINKNAAHRQC